MSAENRLIKHNDDYAAYCSQLGVAYLELERAEERVAALKTAIAGCRERYNEAANYIEPKTGPSEAAAQNE